MVAQKYNMTQALSEWQELLGTESVISEQESRIYYGKTTFLASDETIKGALRITDAEKVPQVVKIARQNKVPLYPISAGKNWGYGNAIPPEEAVVLDLSKLKGIPYFDRELGIVTIESGVTQQDLYEFLKKESSSFLVPVHGGGPQCSIVGNALERGYGITPIADHFSAVLSVNAVLPDGSVYQGALHEMGGVETNRLHKWGVGPYLDGLFSQGNFGVVTSMTFALAPIPEKVELVFFNIRDNAELKQAITALQKVLRVTGGTTGSFNLMNARRVLSMQIEYPKEKTPPHQIVPPKLIAEMAKMNQITAWTGIGAIYGDSRMVRSTKSLIHSILGPEVSRLLFITPTMIRQGSKFARLVPGHLGEGIRETIHSLQELLEILSGKPNEIALPLAYWKSGVSMPEKQALDPARDRCGLYWYSPLIPFRPEIVSKYIDMVTEICTRHGIEPLITLTTISPLCFDSTVPILFNLSDSEEAERAQRCYQDLFEGGRNMGLVPYRLNIKQLSKFADASPFSQSFASTLKEAIDPDHIIAPGRYVSRKKKG